MTSPLPDFPETAWRGAFLRWREIVEPITDCPLPYHFGNLLAVLSAQLGDFAVLDEGVDTFLNFYIFNYGRTGTRKSTAMDLIHQHLVRRFDPVHFTALSSINSAEGLMRVLATPPHNVLLHYDEVKHLIDVANRSGSAVESVINKGFALNDMSTCVRQASASLAGVPYFFVLVVNGTPVHMANVSETLFHGGMVNRFFVFAAFPSERHLPRLLKPDVAAVEDFAARLTQHIGAWRNFAGVDSAGRLNRGAVRVGISDEAMDVFVPWDAKLDRKTKTDHELSAAPVMRVTHYAKKLAAMFCIWEQPYPEPEPQITAEQMAAAIDVATYCQASILFMSSAWNIRTVGARGDALAETRVEEYLKDHGCSNERTLAKSLHMGIGEVKRAVSSLASINTVKVGLERPAVIHFVDTCACFAPQPSTPPAAPEPSTAAFEETPMYAPEDE